jgi:Ca-activated chloride channel family protein
MKNAKIEELKPSLEITGQPDPRGLGGLIMMEGDVEKPLPLQEVKVRANVVGNCCRTVVEQRFQNPLKVALAAVHIFPLPEEGAIVEMELQAGDVSVKAECREREEAEKIFQEAQESGYQAGLLTQERADVHTLRVTNLPPQTEVVVKLVLIEQLETIDGRLRWRFPTVIAPRYLPGEPIGHEGPGVLPDSDHAPDASRLQPPLRLEGGTSLDLEVRILGPVQDLASSLHALRVDLGKNGKEGVRIAPSGKATLDRDFVLAFTTGEESNAVVRAYSDGTYSLILVEPPTLELPEALPRDAVFIIDRSGSMNGPKMEAAKLALKSALHGLQEGDHFNLIAFSSGHEAFSEQLVGYSQETLDQADRWIDQINAQGGTEMLPAVRESFKFDKNDGHVSTVLLITDGQVWNETELVAAVGHRRGEIRFFTMGIGTAVSANLLKRMAKVGGGTCELLTPKDDIEAAVAHLEARFGTPMAEGVRVVGGAVADDRPRTLFSGRSESWIMEGRPEIVKVLGKTPTGELDLETSVDEIDISLGSLWARERVASLENRMTMHAHEEESLRPEILRIALEHGIVSRFTAFVAVERSSKVTGERVEIVQPVELPMDWDEAFLGVPGGDQLRSMSLGQAVPKNMMASVATPAPQFLLQADEVVRRKKRKGEEGRPGAPGKQGQVSFDGQLARLQGADGSYDGDVPRTAAALIALVILGHSRRKGIRRRTVIKAVKWLEGKKGQREADTALEALSRLEAGEDPRTFLKEYDQVLKELRKAGEEGKILEKVLLTK